MKSMQKCICAGPIGITNGVGAEEGSLMTKSQQYKTDEKGLEVIQRLMNRHPLYNISNEVNVDKYDLDNFVSKLQEMGIKYNG